MLGGGLPDPLETVLIRSLVIVLEIDTREEPGIEAHLCKEASVGIGVSKRINMPTYPWLLPEFLEEPLMTLVHIIDLILVVSAGLIMHAPASIDNIQAACLNELAHLSLHVT